jgi:hypothetical protein
VLSRISECDVSARSADLAAFEDIVFAIKAAAIIKDEAAIKVRRHLRIIKFSNTFNLPQKCYELRRAATTLMVWSLTAEAPLLLSHSFLPHF